MKKILKGSSFFEALLKMNMLPLILLTLVITTFSAVRFAASINVETKNGLVNLSHTVVTLYDTVYEGDYHAVEEDGAVYLMKGDHTINGNFAIIDSIKEKTGVDISIFYQDTRVITTIRSDGGERVTGTKANGTVVEDVLKAGSRIFMRAQWWKMSAIFLIMSRFMALTEHVSAYFSSESRLRRLRA